MPGRLATIDEAVQILGLHRCVIVRLIGEDKLSWTLSPDKQMMVVLPSDRANFLQSIGAVNSGAPAEQATYVPARRRRPCTITEIDCFRPQR